MAVKSGGSYLKAFEVRLNGAYLVEAPMEDLLHRVTIK